MTAVYAILLIGILIFVHELGHFIFAKLVGIKVLKFSLGLGPAIISRKYGETTYQLSAFPIGGFVKMHGEDQEPDSTELEEPERSFAAQSVFKRFLVVSAGSVFNLLFAALLFCIVLMTGIPKLKAVIGEVLPDSPARAAGMMKGDIVTAIDGEPLKHWDKLTGIIHDSAGKSLAVSIHRDTEDIVIHITPKRETTKDIFGQDIQVGLVGIKPSGDSEIERYGLFQGIYQGFARTWDVIALTLLSVVKLIQRVVPADTIGGPIMIFQLAGKQATSGFLQFVTFMAVISINLGVFNLFPIPILDGGHIVYLAIEGIRKKPLSVQAMAVTQKVGLAFLLLLMVFAVYNDVLRLLGKSPMPY
ncbi:MAG: RIP metalloprotease RseP [Nitrospirae bacterium]|uniref:RIP metalloprotease RseP n=1 Tax=Candidatus Magnetobacterium casense TaxID=1455061 RepID=UPI00058B6CB3|nr:RIP metalloprotease RseP [Candidatus Magnetobacterium casensis]MBF0337752.1 RIP metalloprotease RseP [Nitrospirota bacterium]